MSLLFHQFRTIVSDAVVSFILSYLIHITVQQPMRNLRQILLLWRQLFDVKSTTNLVSKCTSNITFSECTNGTFTKMADDPLTPAPSVLAKQTIVLNLNAHDNGHLDMPVSVNNSDQNNNDDN